MAADVTGLDEVRAAVARRWQELDELRAHVAQMRAVLSMLRAFGLARDGEAVGAAISAWVEGGMDGPLRWPDCPGFDDWAAAHGLACVDGRVSVALAA